MSVSRECGKTQRNRVLGAVAAAAAATVLASCAAAGQGAGAGAGTPGPSQQAGLPAPGRASSLIISGGLYGVAALSAADVWAVGSTPMTDPMTVRWNGSAWTEKVLTLLKGQPGNPPGSFAAVATVSPHDVWAVGVTAGQPLAQHWNGRAWTVVPTPSPGPQGSGIGADLYSVAAVSARDAWAVGGTNGGKTWIIRWDGTAWTRVPSPSPGQSAQLNRVAAASADSAWAVGSYTSPATGISLLLIEHWDGHAWTAVPSPAIRGGAALMGVAAASPDSAWAVGGGGEGALIEHWDGRAWARVPSPHLAGGGTLRAVAALSPASAWAVGTGSLRPGHSLTTVIEHWDGRAWTLVPSPATGDLTAVTAASADSAWAVGSSSVGGGGTAVIEHWDGKAWTWPPGFCASPAGPGCPAPPSQPPGSS
ncbi:hypothetical protein EAS64_30410 [Trebonia kvetii]|uniref:Uncharacterized protein n=1 Tax=Trebonia kvetii TaxID=2480626 RepID=A0A6P2BS47_9ACTN|nr:hypothetical protein [Trebonia kvetii]TVZ01770.1 hypothetical protein EAS64_30410 [Trebonia kvetii]